MAESNEKPQDPFKALMAKTGAVEHIVDNKGVIGGSPSQPTKGTDPDNVEADALRDTQPDQTQEPTEQRVPKDRLDKVIGERNVLRDEGKKQRAESEKLRQELATAQSKLGRAEASKKLEEAMSKLPPDFEEWPTARQWQHLEGIKASLHVEPEPAPSASVPPDESIARLTYGDEISTELDSDFTGKQRTAFWEVHQQHPTLSAADVYAMAARHDSDLFGEDEGAAETTPPPSHRVQVPASRRKKPGRKSSDDIRKEALVNVHKARNQGDRNRAFDQWAKEALFRGS